MKRDMDLIRTLILRMEDHEDSIVYTMDNSVENFTPDEVHYHYYLMLDAGLIFGQVTHSQTGGPAAMPLHLTWAGHEFAAVARDEGIWAKASKSIREHAVSVSFGVLGEYLKQLVKEKLGIG